MNGKGRQERGRWDPGGGGMDREGLIVIMNSGKEKRTHFF